MTYYQRTDYGLPLQVRGFNKVTLRKALPSKLSTVVVHYTGNKVKYATRDTRRSIADLNRWKNNEYNYVIDQVGDVYELAGKFESAHCLGWNHRSYGVLFLNGTAEPVTDAQVASFGWLMNVLRFAQQVVPSPSILKHSDLRATACPGLVGWRWAEIQAS